MYRMAKSIAVTKYGDNLFMNKKSYDQFKFLDGNSNMHGKDNQVMATCIVLECC